ncbi:hypothetical protein AVEN_114551-1 [Araneus ventricosus]|uniref:Uncharacterized protein n=1 Tax=Araneus ventricosus TaxID=182803 RepID=A0A4Y2JGH1_ARAVE|nr:hypothetical protein AVEN_114551-1 [Araneus ventricosus]
MYHDKDIDQPFNDDRSLDAQVLSKQSNKQKEKGSTPKNWEIFINPPIPKTIRIEDRYGNDRVPGPQNTGTSEFLDFKMWERPSSWTSKYAYPPSAWTSKCGNSRVPGPQNTGTLEFLDLKIRERPSSSFKVKGNSLPPQNPQ